MVDSLGTTKVGPLTFNMWMLLFFVVILVISFFLAQFLQDSRSSSITVGPASSVTAEGITVTPE